MSKLNTAKESYMPPEKQISSQFNKLMMIFGDKGSKVITPLGMPSPMNKNSIFHNTSVIEAKNNNGLQSPIRKTGDQ